MFALVPVVAWIRPEVQDGFSRRIGDSLIDERCQTHHDQRDAHNCDGFHLRILYSTSDRTVQSLMTKGRRMCSALIQFAPGLGRALLDILRASYKTAVRAFP